MNAKAEVALIYRNIAIIGFTWFLLFTSYHGVVILQSSMNKSSGSNSLALKVTMMILSGLTFNAWLVKKITVKWSLVLGMCCYITYISGQLYPPLLLITGTIMGLGASPFWIGFATYITQASKRLSTLTNDSSSNIACQLFSLTNACIQISYCSGSLIASTVLSSHAGKFNLTQEESNRCGINFCPANETTYSMKTLERPNEADIRLLIFILTGLGGLAALIIGLFLDPLSKFDGRMEDQQQIKQLSVLESLKGTVMLMLSKKMMLLSLLTILAGFAHGYVVADFDAAYVACSLGIHMIGYTTFTFGLVNTIGCFFVMFFTKICGRILVYASAGILEISAIFLMFYWSKQTDLKMLIYVIAALLGLADCVWQSLIKVVYSSHFPNNPEEAFSVLEIFVPLGFLLCYSSQPILCNFTKIIILLSLLCGGLFFFFILEYKYKVSGNDTKKYVKVDQLLNSDQEEKEEEIIRIKPC